MRSLSHAVATMLAGATLLLSGIAVAQDYPSMPIRIITTEVGGVGDTLLRLIRGNGLADIGGQPTIIDNRPALVAAEGVARAAPDGYTLLAQGNGFWNLPFLQKTTYDPVNEYSTITILSNTPSILVVHPSVMANSVKELIALAKAKSGQLNFSNVGPASSSNLGAELLKSMAGINMVGIPYKGSPQALTAVVAGEVQVTFALAGQAVPLVKAGKVKALAITSVRQSALFPELPTVASTGLPGFESGSLVGLFAPAGTPAPIINRLNREVVQVLLRPDVKEKLLNIGLEAVGSSPQESASQMKADMDRTGKLIKEAGIKPG